jgi:hypothetical protein
MFHSWFVYYLYNSQKTNDFIIFIVNDEYGAGKRCQSLFRFKSAKAVSPMLLSGRY